jgi:uncharacterized LabA/DUF88 family protein
MKIEELKKEFIKEALNIKEYGRIFSFIDFANVNKWFENDNQDWNNNLIKENERLIIDLNKLENFADIVSDKTRLYYGKDPKNKKSLVFTYVIRKIFGKRNIITKDIQKIRHYIDFDEDLSSKIIMKDKDGEKYIEIRKCNFDVEIAVDAIKMINHYDTFCIFSGDADFVYLNNFLKKQGKKIIVVKGGYITNKLRKTADLVLNAQNIKKHIARVEKTKT